MTAKVFVDTNVIVYLRDAAEPEKQRRAAEWFGLLWEAQLGRLSVQVLQEYYSIITKKLDPPMDPEDARDDVAALAAWKPIGIDMDTLETAWQIQDDCGFSWWDSLIVAAAKTAGCRYLLTEDLQDGQVIDGLTIISPFTHEPKSVLSS